VTSQHLKQFDFVKIVANRLAEKFIQPLFASIKEKNYSTQVGGLAEILAWAEEFYDQYHNKIIDWEAFRNGKDNIYKAATLQDLIGAFGQEKLKAFHAQNANHSTYFNEKYAAVLNAAVDEEFYYSSGGDIND
jgi:hypothetical protein